ncbi:hypothetical protein IJJ37_00885 [Candidatus Saccharibacteria bacterium]|nr:hypothetical protein [Candidatus Saccharibacteria bacterium]
MNRKYIDFVPKTTVKHEAGVPGNSGRGNFEVEEIFVEKEVARGRGMGGAMDGERKMVGRESGERKMADIKKVKAKKIAKMPLMSRKKLEPKKSADEGNQGAASRVKAKDERAMEAAVKDAHELDKKLKIPKVAFVNTEKVVKRPLSKNVYTRKIETPKEEPKGPVTIIAKPEKDSKAGLIVTIIITIILGAAAGTVAFLLLPK